VQRGLRQKLLETYPGFEPYIEEIMPKKASLEAVKLYVGQQNPSPHHPTSSLPSYMNQNPTNTTPAPNVQPCTQ
jgi:hypothetical protein